MQRAKKKKKKKKKVTSPKITYEWVMLLQG